MAGNATPAQAATSNIYKTEINALSEEDYYLLAQIVTAEGNTSNLRCMEGIVITIINRKLSSAYPNTVRKVILQPGEFWLDGISGVAQGAITAIENVAASGGSRMQDAIYEAGYDYDVTEILFFSTHWKKQKRYAKDFVKVDKHWYGRMKDAEM